jgi:hypothetical protein
MAKMGKYCKAYLVSRFREFDGWKEDLQNARMEKCEIEGKEVERLRQLTDEDHLFLQEDFTVTYGIFLEKNVIFSEVTPKWKNYCSEILRFEIPEAETDTKRSQTAEKV